MHSMSLIGRILQTHWICSKLGYIMSVSETSTSNFRGLNEPSPSKGFTPTQFASQEGDQNFSMSRAVGEMRDNRLNMSSSKAY